MSRAPRQGPPRRPLQQSLGTPRKAFSQLASTHLKAVEVSTPASPLCASQVELLDLGSPFACKPNVVAYDRHVLFAPDDPADATRHSSPSPISTPRIDEAFVHEMPE